MNGIPKSIPQKYRDRILHWDDERSIGNSLIISLKDGWRWAGIDPLAAMHVAGFDTVREALDELRETAECDCEDCRGQK